MSGALLEEAHLGRWDSSNRSSRLPGNWDSIRQKVRKRDDYQCTWTDRVEGERVRCPGPADDVDHIKPGDDHSLENLRSLCHAHHARKTSREGHFANWAQRREIHKKFRRTETHPGLALGGNARIG